MIKDILKELESLDARIEALQNPAEEPDTETRLLGGTGQLPESEAALAELEALRSQLLAQCRDLTAADRVLLARHQGRPRIDEYIDVLFTDFFEQRGDRFCSDDASIYGGIARYKGVPVTVIGHRKGSTLEENMQYRFGMPEPDGYRRRKNSDAPSSPLLTRRALTPARRPRNGARARPSPATWPR